MTKLTGRSIIGFREGTASAEAFYGVDPTTARRLEPSFFTATREEIDSAAELAYEAFAVYGRLSGRERGQFLRKIASNIEAVGEELIERAHQETALPKARLQGETSRTCGQLRLFAQVAEEGSWVAARIDHAEPSRKPAPKPDIRSMLRPMGAVVVFGASNFPLAFSVAGGDTASALAAGNPVMVKAHPAHPGTSEIVGRAILASSKECGMPEGVFSLLFDSGTQVGISLVKHPRVKAVGFTGSRVAGKALMEVAAARPEPIPLFAEMSSTNPLFILPGALRERREALATGLHSSFTLGAGQFCTKPGMVFVERGAEAEGLIRKLNDLVGSSGQFQLLTPGIRWAYMSAIAARKNHGAITTITEARLPAEAGECVGAVLFETDAQSFLKNPGADSEIFGPTTLVVQHSKREELLEIARRLEGHLTATVQGTESDLREFADLIAILETKVGRIIFNGFPTGVEVTHAMVHGGPYPATSDSRFTSVGTQAILRFARPVCYQGFPDVALPRELQDSNPLGIWRMINGEMTREANARVLSSRAS